MLLLVLMRKFLPLVALVFAGCVGTHFNFDEVRQVQPGMTEQQVQQIMGKPNVVTAQGNRIRWVYAYGTAVGTGASASFVFENGRVVEVPVVPASFR